jgi:hypothetical protein
MISGNRDLLLVIRNESMSEQAIETEVQCLNYILTSAESYLNFCKVHELVDRNCITSRHSRILKESRFYELRPFRFLLNKN